MLFAKHCYSNDVYNHTHRIDKYRLQHIYTSAKTINKKLIGHGDLGSESSRQ